MEQDIAFALSLVSTAWFAWRARYWKANSDGDYWWREYCKVRKQISALRDNAFITNSKGHRVRYTNATAEERAKAEGAV